MTTLRIGAGIAAAVAFGLAAPVHAQDANADADVSVAAPDDAPSPFQYELYYSTTARYQVDNGTRTEREDGEIWDPTGEDFVEWTNTFGGSITYRAFQLSVQGDAAYYPRQPVPAQDALTPVRLDLSSRYEDVFRLEFISLSYSDRYIDVTLGDFYVTLARGMLLSIRKVADVGIDNKLRGGEIRTRLGPITLHAFGGFLNIRNYEAGQAFFYPEALPDSNCSDFAAALVVCPNGIDLIGGARAEYRFGKYLKVGGHAAYIDAPDSRAEAEDQIDGDLRGYGASIELPRPVKWLNAYFEGVRLEQTDGIPEDPNRVNKGQGIYGNINLYLGRTTLLFEGKAYDNLFNVVPRSYFQNQPPTDRTSTRQVLNRILEPPTAERPFTRILANNTVYGGRVRADYRVTSKFVPFISGGYFRDTSFQVPTNIFFGFGGFRWRWKGGEASVNAGYRAQLNDTDTDGAARAVSDAEAAVAAAMTDVERIQAEAQLQSAQSRLQSERDRDGQAFRNDAHLRFDVSFDVGGPYSLEFFGDTFYVIAETNDPREYVEGRLSVSLRSRQGWSLTGAYEFYSAEPQTFAVHYPSFGGQWDFTEGGTVRFLVGGERAGLKCSGGVCRFFPGFEGGRLELALRL